MSRRIRKARRHGTRDGFTLVEFLLAAVVTLGLAGVIFNFVAPAHRIFQAQPEQSDLQQRLRVTVDTFTRDLVMAGAGTYLGPAAGPLTYAVAPIFPYKAFGDMPDSAQGTFFRRDAISFLYVPATPAQTTLEQPLAASALDAQLAWMPNCPPATATQLCGFKNGDRLMIFDRESQWDIYTAGQVGAGFVTLQHRGAPAAARYEIGAAVSEVRLGSYSLKSDDTNRIYQLMRHDGWATELPVVDDVVDLAFDYFGDPEPPRLTGKPLDEMPGPWTTYGPAPPPLTQTQGSWPAGENCTFLVANGSHAPRLPVLSGGGASNVQLTPGILTDGPWCPNVVAANRFDADLLRVRRVRMTLRVQAALASLRGPAGLLFLKGGTARAGERYVPDLEVQFDVTPRNMNLGR